MVTLLAVLGVVAVLFVAAVVATRDDEVLADAPPDAPDLALPPGRLQADDVRRVRFGLAVRGYRMSEVDVVLERLAAELADRDARLAGRDAQPADRTPPGDGEAPRLAEPATAGDDGA